MPQHPTKLKRSLNPLIGHSVTINLNSVQSQIVNRIHGQGLHGNTPSQVVNRIFCEGLAKYAQPATEQHP